MQVFIPAYMYAEIRGFAKLINHPKESNVLFYLTAKFLLPMELINERTDKKND